MTEERPIILQRLNKFIKAISVEPVAFLMISGIFLASTTSQTLGIEKTCRVNLNLSEEICDALRLQENNDNAESERLVQEYLANLAAYRSIIISVLPCVLLVFVGGWMDLTGRRKIIMILSVGGEITVQLNNIINVIFFYQLKVEFLIFFDAVLSSIFGAWSLLFLAIFSYIAVVTSEKDRTYRLGLVSFCIFIGMPVGVALSGFLLKAFGYLTVYIVSLLMAVTNACYLIFFLSDPERTKEHKKHDNRGFIYVMKSFFNPIHFLDSLKVIFKKTNNNRAVRLCFLLGATCFLFGPMYGEGAIMYMSTRYRFNWDELQFSLFQTYNMVLNIVGVMFCLLVVSKKLGCHDSVVGIISSTSKIAAAFIYCFAATGAVFYLGPAIDMFNGSAFIAIRSIFSKTVEPHEIGKLNSIVGIFEVILPMAYIPLYTQIYIATMETFPGFIFLVGIAVTMPPLLLFIWLLYKHLQKNSKTQKVEES